MADQQGPFRFPDNAYRELQPGEAYVPMVPPNVAVPELTLRAIVFGLVMNIIFSVAATFLALKAGQGIETAIPISILTVGLSGLLIQMGRRATSMLENVYILAISTTSGYIAGGTCFTMPAVYILKLNESLGMSTASLFLQITLPPFLGAILGVIFLIPFRRYFVKEMHGKLPFPEATATNEILVTGASGSAAQAWVLIYSFLVAAAYNFLSVAMKLFSETFTTGEATLETLRHGKHAALAFGPEGLFARLTNDVKAVFGLGTGPYYLGLGVIIGIRYASIICAGSFLSWFVIIPLLAPIGLEQLKAINPAISDTSAHGIFLGVPRNIGIGAIFAAGLISILKMGKIIVTALHQALGGLFKSRGVASAHERTDEDLSYPMMMVIGAAAVLVMIIFFRFTVLRDMPGSNSLTIVSVLITLIIAFLFTTVSAWAIAMISVTPISGMTVTTIIITAVLLSLAGLPKGDASMLATLLIGGVVCNALSMAGGLVTNFKLGYWLGASPKRIAGSALVGSLVSCVFVCGTIMVLSLKPGFGPDGLPAPQANMMGSALDSFLGVGQVPWLLYGVGVVIALIVHLLGISALAFGLGMYLPMEINTPILVGAIVAWLIQRSTRDEKRKKARVNKGVLIASGLIAGAAIMEVLLNFLAIVDERLFEPQGKIMPFLEIPSRLIDANRDPAGLVRFGNWFGLIAFLLLCIWAYWDSCRARPES